MTLQVKEALLRASLLGGIFNSVISPTYGMMLEKDSISSLPSIERTINKRNEKETIEFSREEIEQLHRNAHSFTTEDLNLWVKFAETGNFTGLYHLGWLMDQKEKRKTPRLEKSKARTLILEEAKAFYLWKRAQHQDNLEAWVELGKLYEIGKGLEQNYTNAMGWYLKAAEQNNSDAQYHIGLMYKNGKGVKRDYAQAMDWFLKAANQAHPWAQYNIGESYQYGGEGVKQDYAVSMKWFLMAAKQGHPGAQYSTGELYEYGAGVKRNYSKAIKWYFKALEQNYPEAQYRILFLYTTGQWIKKYDDKSLNLLSKVAGYTCAATKYNTGYLGGVEMNHILNIITASNKKISNFK